MKKVIASIRKGDLDMLWELPPKYLFYMAISFIIFFLSVSFASFWLMGF